MSLKNFGLCLLLCWSVVGRKCPAKFEPPQECFSAEELLRYGPTSTSIEYLYNKYVNLLTEADITIDSHEVSH